MCVMSMVMDHYQEKWGGSGSGTIPLVPTPITVTYTGIAPAEIAEFRKLLDRAREYDRKHNEPSCELQEKKDALKLIATQLGVDISFIDEA